MNYEPFPNIQIYLSKDSSTYKATLGNTDRNIAQVILDVYNVIPGNQIECRDTYQKMMDRWLRQDILHTAPELFGHIWIMTQQLIMQILLPHIEQDWYMKCAYVFSGRSDI